jgi:pimeloyl-ACP methyl ester carboxylesterase
VFVHGYALQGTGEIYTSLIDRLAAEFDVYALDLRGHGASAPSFANWSQAAIADDVAAFVQKMGLSGAVYAGHSLGGFTGMYAQIRHPGTFSALALLATAVAAGGAPVPGLKENFVTKGRDRSFTEPAFSSMYLHPAPGDVRRAADAVGLIHPSVHDTFFSNFANVVITDRLPEIRVPVLLVNGGKDNVVSPAEQHKTALGLGQHKEVTFSHEGHMLPIESAEATAREMITFFKHDVAGYRSAK